MIGHIRAAAPYGPAVGTEYAEGSRHDWPAWKPAPRPDRRPRRKWPRADRL